MACRESGVWFVKMDEKLKMYLYVYDFAPGFAGRKLQYCNK
jgi:hypothetical protein